MANQKPLLEMSWSIISQWISSSVMFDIDVQVTIRNDSRGSSYFTFLSTSTRDGSQADLFDFLGRRPSLGNLKESFRVTYSMASERCLSHAAIKADATD